MLFGNNYNRPGPGVSKDAPRKKGLARLFELLARDFAAYWRAGFLAGLSLVPTAVCLFLAIDTRALIFVLAGGAFGALAGPAQVALYDTVLRTLRDEPGYWWYVYRRSFRRNARSAVMPGVVSMLLLCLEIYCATLLLASGGGTGAVWVCLLLCAFLLSARVPLYWAQLALLELSAVDLLRNCVLLLFAYLPRTAGGALLQLAYWAAVVLLFPASMVVFAVTGFWLPVLLAVFTMYPPMNKSFDLEARVATKQKADRAAVGSTPAAGPSGADAPAGAAAPEHHPD